MFVPQALLICGRTGGTEGRRGRRFFFFWDFFFFSSPPGRFAFHPPPKFRCVPSLVFPFFRYFMFPLPLSGNPALSMYSFVRDRVADHRRARQPSRRRRPGGLTGYTAPYHRRCTSLNESQWFATSLLPSRIPCKEGHPGFRVSRARAAESQSRLSFLGTRASCPSPLYPSFHVSPTAALAVSLAAPGELPPGFSLLINDTGLLGCPSWTA